MPASRSIAQDIGLFVVLLIVADGLVLPAVMSPALVSSTRAIETFHLALAAHVMATLYVGTFGAVRTLTWLVLIGAWVGSEVADFTSYVLAWNQLPILAAAAAALGALWPVAALLILGLDIAAMHVAVPRQHAVRSFAMLLAAAIAVALIGRVPLSAFDLANLPDPGPSRAFDIVPAWHALPFYAMLRVVPDKAIGVGITFAALLMPMIWPWIRADRLRLGGTRWAWRLAWTAFAATVIGLGWLGAQPLDESTMLAARVLTLAYFAYFLAVPLMVRRVAPAPA